MERSSAHATRAVAAASSSSTATASTNDPIRKRKRGALQDISNNSKKLTQSRVSTRRGSSGVVKKDRRAGVAVTKPRTRVPLRSSTRSAASSTASTANSSVNTTLSSSMASSTTSKSTAKKRSTAVPLMKTELATKKRKHDAAGLENQPPPHQKVQTSMLSFQATKTTATRTSRVGLRNVTGQTVDPLVPATSSATASDAKASLKPTIAKVEPQQLVVKSDAVMSGVEEQAVPVKNEVAEQDDEPMLPTLAEIEAMPLQPGEYVPRPYKFTFDHRNSGFDEQTYATSVHDIDTPSDSMSSHCAKLVREMDAYHRKHESKYLPEVDYIGTVQTDINEKMRTILIDWLVEVGEEYDLDSQTFHKAVNLVDRCLKKIKINRKQFQLLGCACMMIAAKFEEVYGPNVEEFVYISDQTYTAEEMLDMEAKVLTALEYRVASTTCYGFVSRFIKAGCNTDKQRSLVMYLCDFVLLYYHMVKFKPSKLVASAVYLARVMTDEAEPWTPTLHHFTKYSPLELQDCVEELHRLHAIECQVVSTQRDKAKAVSEKYLADKFHAASTIPSCDDATLTKSFAPYMPS